MDKQKILLIESIDKFLTGKVGALLFEKEYTDIFDFADLNDEVIDDYFKEVRELLEHYTSEQKDIKDYPEYYIDEKKLKAGIIRLKNKLKVK
jgi:hypothetical protein